MAGPNTFIAGKCDSNNNWSVTNLAVDPRDTEIEFCVQAVGADLENDDTLELRMANMDTYTVIATATITGLPASNIPGSIFQSNIFGGSVIRG